MEHSQGIWHGVSTQYTKTEKRGNLFHPVGQGKVGRGGGGWGVSPTYLQVFSQTIPLLYSSVPSQQSEGRGVGTIGPGSASSLPPPSTLFPTPGISHSPQTPSLTHLEEMYRGL